MSGGCRSGLPLLSVVAAVQTKFSVAVLLVPSKQTILLQCKGDWHCTIMVWLLPSQITGGAQPDLCS
jgi:hypothetical protein